MKIRVPFPKRNAVKRKMKNLGIQPYASQITELANQTTPITEMEVYRFFHGSSNANGLLIMKCANQLIDQANIELGNETIAQLNGNINSKG